MLLKDPFAPVDNYCERLHAGFWAEPINAVSNGAFLIAAAAAFWLWRRAGGRDYPALWLIVITAVVGIGSFLFHTLANHWSLLADVVPIAVFIYSYFLLAMRRFLGLSLAATIAVTAGFLAFNLWFERLWFAAVGPVKLNGSVGYMPAALAMLVVGAVIRLRAAQGGRRVVEAPRGAGRALLLAGAVFVVSLAFRTVDHAICPSLPIGTHYLWHGLNALVLFVLMRAAIVFGRSGSIAS